MKDAKEKNKIENRNILIEQIKVNTFPIEDVKSTKNIKY